MNDLGDPRPDGKRVEEKRLFKGLRVEILIGVCALLVSSLATAASVWQSRIVAQQLASQVWPYLTIEVDSSAKALALRITNDGLGPARVRSVVMTVDGAPHKYLLDAMRALEPAVMPHPQGTFADTGAGLVIRVGGSQTLFSVVDRPSIALFAKNAKRVDLHVCYCAIIPGSCWRVERNGGEPNDADPLPVAVCPGETRYMFQSGVGLAP